MRCSWTGGARDWITKTSASRQFAPSCTPRQSLLNRLVVDGLRRVLRRVQIAFARPGCALPLKTTMLFIALFGRAGTLSQAAGEGKGPPEDTQGEKMSANPAR